MLPNETKTVIVSNLWAEIKDRKIMKTITVTWWTGWELNQT